MAQYGLSSYWDERYKQDPEPFDWYQRYPGLKETFDGLLKKEEPILMLGCGNSRLSEDMAFDGYRSIANIDISRVVIDQMRGRMKGRPELSWEVMDCCRLTHPPTSFAAVIDKGTLDSLLCGDESVANAAKVCEQVLRVLKPGGVFIVVSYGVPDRRLCYLENPAFRWKVTHKVIAKPVINGDGSNSQAGISSPSAEAVPASTSSSSGAPSPGQAAAAPTASAGGAAMREVHYIYVCTKA